MKKLTIVFILLVPALAFAIPAPLEYKTTWVVHKHFVFAVAGKFPSTKKIYAPASLVASTSGFDVWLFEQTLITDKSLPPEVVDAFNDFMEWIYVDPKAKSIKVE